MHLLVVEDDDAIAIPLTHGLERAGFEVTRVSTGRAALDADGIDLVLLDLGLPDIDGYDVCRQLRARSNVPIIVITARGDEVDRVLGLELGADDYVVKPFGTRELVARVRAVARRSVDSVVSADRNNGDDSVREIGDLVIDHRTRRVTVAGAEVPLTPKEYGVLSILAEDPGAVVTRSQLMDEVWDPHWYGPTKTLDVHVASLRKKLGDPTLIETVRSVGFRLRVAS
jgi:DNA-binding response OmpR family regulator